MPATRYLYLARHAEADHEHGGLTRVGHRQAVLLGERLRGAGVRALHHGPSERTTRTAHLVADRLALDGPGIEPVPTPEAGDYAPYLPTRKEVPPDYAETVMDFVGSLPEKERGPGPELGRRCLERFTGPSAEDRESREAVITHAYPVGWLTGIALGAPPWRWVTLAPANAALTVIRYTPGRAASVLVFNDVSHLEPDLRWTGTPPPLRP
ncbi:histidine phosphatase family protein [Nocardiopsis sp. NPDC058631]|uniref:histidine phosphatase family protein n=1 Tax=Nocardiopsis sp. NPDC058631 TaxID=3346566 RepID=UPI0036604A33